MDIFSVCVKLQNENVMFLLQSMRNHMQWLASSAILFSRCVIFRIMIQTMCYLSPAVWDKEEGRKGSGGPGCTGS